MSERKKNCNEPITYFALVLLCCFKTNPSIFWDFESSLGRSKSGIILRTLQNARYSFTIQCLIEIWVSLYMNSWVQGKNASICFRTSTSVYHCVPHWARVYLLPKRFGEKSLIWWTLYFVWLHVTSWPLCELFHDFLDLMCLWNHRFWPNNSPCLDENNMAQ